MCLLYLSPCMLLVFFFLLVLLLKQQQAEGAQCFTRRVIEAVPSAYLIGCDTNTTVQPLTLVK